MTDSSKQVGRYEVENLLGEGGFGIVYKANDTTLDRPVALKQLRAELSSSPQALERFKQESRSMGSLNHPNIIKVLEVFEDSGRFFIAMDYMPNGSLANKLEQGVPFSVEKTVEILKPIARALDYAHGKNLIHRDIKPSNILFTEEDDPVLSDFGLVKSLVNQGLTTTGTTFGTPEYMSPEQILGKELTPAADLYALGVLTYQMLTGSVPFQGSTPYEIQEGHVHTPPPDILSANSALPAEFSGIFARVMAKKPEDRFSSAREFTQELDRKVSQIRQEKNQEKIAKVQKYLEEKNFPEAIHLLKELIPQNPDIGLQETLKEAERRNKVWMEYKEIRESRSKLKEKLEELRSQETWLENTNFSKENSLLRSSQSGSFRKWLASASEDEPEAEKKSNKSISLSHQEDQQRDFGFLNLIGWLSVLTGAIFIIIGIGNSSPLFWIVGPALLVVGSFLLLRTNNQDE